MWFLSSVPIRRDKTPIRKTVKSRVFLPYFLVPVSTWGSSFNLWWYTNDTRLVSNPDDAYGPLKEPGFYVPFLTITDLIMDTPWTPSLSNTLPRFRCVLTYLWSPITGVSRTKNLLTVTTSLPPSAVTRPDDPSGNWTPVSAHSDVRRPDRPRPRSAVLPRVSALPSTLPRRLVSTTILLVPPTEGSSPSSLRVPVSEDRFPHLPCGPFSVALTRNFRIDEIDDVQYNTHN